MVDLNELQKKVWQNKVNKGFNLTDVAKEFCYLYGEVGEAYDAWLHKDKTEVSLELADVALFLLGLSEMLQIDLEAAVLQKLAINEKRVYINGQKVEPKPEA